MYALLVFSLIAATVAIMSLLARYSHRRACFRYLLILRLLGAMIWSYKIAELTLRHHPESLAAQQESLHDQYAHDLLVLLQRLRGVYAKLAQTALALGVLPARFNTVLTPLLREVPASADFWERVAAQQGQPIEQLFASVDDTPLGVGTIGQAHAARLIDGREVVVKALHPDLKESLQLDFAMLQLAARLLSPDAETRTRMAHTVAAMRDQLEAELDARAEAKAMKRIGMSLRQAGLRSVAVPEPIDDMVRPDMLVMTRIPGRTLQEYFDAAAAEEEARRGLEAGGLEAQVTVSRRHGRQIPHQIPHQARGERREVRRRL